jgi:hypothetical protein
MTRQKPSESVLDRTVIPAPGSAWAYAEEGPVFYGHCHAALDELFHSAGFAPLVDLWSRPEEGDNYHVVYANAWAFVRVTDWVQDPYPPYFIDVEVGLLPAGTFDAGRLLLHPTASLFPGAAAWDTFFDNPGAYDDPAGLPRLLASVWDKHIAIDGPAVWANRKRVAEAIERDAATIRKLGGRSQR